jgi:hypothetical protein
MDLPEPWKLVSCSSKRSYAKVIDNSTARYISNQALYPLSKNALTSHFARIKQTRLWDTNWECCSCCRKVNLSAETLLTLIHVGCWLSLGEIDKRKSPSLSSEIVTNHRWLGWTCTWRHVILVMGAVCLRVTDCSLFRSRFPCGVLGALENIQSTEMHEQHHSTIFAHFWEELSCINRLINIFDDV